MQWAQSIVPRNGQLLASVVDASGRQSHLPLEKLSTQGLPTSGERFRPRLPFRVSNLQATSPDEYLDHFGIKAQAADCMQAVYMLKTYRGKCVIPALALIRGLFQPSQVLLADLFRPQSVERMAIADPDNAKRVKIVAPWSKLQIKSSGCLLRTLEWLLWEPSAAKLARSIHRHAMSGRIDLDVSLIPPDLEIFTFGDRKGNTTFVTSTNALKVTLSAHSSFNAGQLHLLSQSTAGMKNSPLHVERTGTGGLRLTNAEWERVGQHVPRPKRGAVTKHDLKTVFENVLAYAAGDISTQAGLKALDGATPVDLTYYRSWKNAGIFKSMVDELNRLRTEQGSSEA